MTSCSYAQEVLPGDNYKDEAITLNEELRKIKDDITTTAATLPTDLNITGQTTGDYLYFDGTNWIRLANGTTGEIGVTFSNGTSTPTVNTNTWVRVPYDCTVTGWTILGDRTAVHAFIIDVWKDTYANYPPTAADKISGSESPNLGTSPATGKIKNQDLNLTTWTDTTLDAGDIVKFNLTTNNSASNPRQATVFLHTTRR